MSRLWPCRNDPNLHYISPPPPPDWKNRSLAILGSTGSVGQNALAVARESGQFRIVALAAGYNITSLAEQASVWKPAYLAVAESALVKKLRKLLPPGYRPTILYGLQGSATIASLPEADCILSAQAGSVGLTGTLAAALAGKVIALANKESLVVAGQLLADICNRTNAAILPVDSEHFAIFQCVAGRPATSVQRLILTASGGPFLGKTKEYIDKATPREALNHPNWNMGAKISIDSATMMNKGLEYIEAAHLFGVSPGKIQILVHPQSIVHSLVEFTDNALLGQFAVPDMRLPIAGCLTWPNCERSFIEPLNLAAIGPLSFQNPDLDLFPCLRLALDAATYRPPAQWQQSGLNPACIVLNSANEAGVQLFLEGQCTLGAIANAIRTALDTLVYDSLPPAPAMPAEKDFASQAMALAALTEPLAQQARQSVLASVSAGPVPASQ